VQYPVWYPENFGHLQTSMWLRPDHTNTQRIQAIADRGSMLVEASAKPLRAGKELVRPQNAGRVCGLELYSGVSNVPKNKSKE
jgi:hypothetical protein